MYPSETAKVPMKVNIDLDIQSYARIYRKLADIFKRRADGETYERKIKFFQIRKMFCEIADTCPRSAASISDIERVFSDCIRSTDNRGHKLRNVLIKNKFVLLSIVLTLSKF